MALFLGFWFSIHLGAKISLLMIDLVTHQHFVNLAVVHRIFELTIFLTLPFIFPA